MILGLEQILADFIPKCSKYKEINLKAASASTAKKTGSSKNDVFFLQHIAEQHRVELYPAKGQKGK